MTTSRPAPRVDQKVQDLDDLAATLAVLHDEGKRIVHCHGVFDLLHIGHILYLQKAKSFGDVLVVTITPDHFVNKGPHRPAFTAELRAQSLAALGCVDYVAVNRWPNAVQTIHKLRPTFYVKGSDYKDAAKDPTGGIILEEEAVQAVGGQIVFTDEMTFSSSTLLNRHFPAFPKETSDFLASFALRYSEGDILRYLENARPLKVLVVGETIIDEYQFCEAIGKSSKEPMLALKHQNTERYAGGILAVGNNAANFCDNVGLLTFLGTTSSHEDFIRHHLRDNIEKMFLYRKDSPTLVKRRFVESYFFTKLLEIYEMNDSALDPADNERLCSMLSDQLPLYDVVIVVDFGHGMLSREAVDVLCSRSRFLAINTQSNAGNLGYHAVSKYPRADFVCVAEKEIRLEARDRGGDLQEIIEDVSRRLGAERVVVTRGKNGCLCYSRSEGFVEVPAFAGQVIDRMGAGDAFLSIAALCAAQGAPMEVLGFIGNAVGAQAVATVGHASSIEQASLVKHIQAILK